VFNALNNFRFASAKKRRSAYRLAKKSRRKSDKYSHLSIATVNYVRILLGYLLYGLR